MLVVVVPCKAIQFFSNEISVANQDMKCHHEVLGILIRQPMSQACLMQNFIEQVTPGTNLEFCDNLCESGIKLNYHVC